MSSTDRARTRASSTSAMAMSACSRWRATTIPRSSSPIRARRPGSAASCATSSPWARGPSPVSTSSASARPITPRPGASSPAWPRGSAATAIRSACRRSAARPASIRRYDGNILVNAMAVGVARRDAIFTSKATGVGNPIVYLGSKTGRDGIHGASMASAAFEADAEEKRPTVQVGDPFAEKLLLEACLELMASGAVIAIQDMGAAGLTSSAAEMGAKGDLGVELDLDRVPCRETGMSAYEIMLSESQERMLMVLQAREGERGRGHLPQMGARFRGHRQDHRHEALRRQAGRRGQGGPADQGARRSGAALRPPVDADAARRRFSTRPRSRRRCRPTRR